MNYYEITVTVWCAGFIGIILGLWYSRRFERWNR